MAALRQELGGAPTGMAKGQPPDERELRRLALAVRMYQEGRPHWELPAGERHSRVWEWVWCAAEWALWMLLLLWDLLSRGALSSTARPPPVSPPPASTPQNRIASASTRRFWCPRARRARGVPPRRDRAAIATASGSITLYFYNDLIEI